MQVKKVLNLLEFKMSRILIHLFAEYGSEEVILISLIHHAELQLTTIGG